MFSSKKKVKSKDPVNTKDANNKRLSKNISKQLKNLMGRKKTSDTDNVSQVTSVDSNTDTSVRSSMADSANVETPVNITAVLGDESDNDHDEKDISYPIWYKQTLSLPRCGAIYFETITSLNISRTLKGDFGFVLRKGNFVERFTIDDGSFSESKQLAIFSEPVNMNKENLLLPGDKLVKVNQINIQNMTRENIIDLIKSCGDEVNLTIQPSPECLEFSFRRFTDLFFNHVNVRFWLKEKRGFCGIYKEYYNKVKNNFESIKSVELVTEDQLTVSKSKNMEEKVWINFNEGFAAGSIIKKLDGKCLIKLTDNDSEIEVSEEDIHLANSTVYDLEENLLLLPHLNESSLLYNIRLRFSKNLIHTYVGKHLLYINPMISLNCFSEKTMHLFKGANSEDIPPHIYSTAQNTFQNLKSTKENQAICILGRSGSGKSMVLRHLVNYFMSITSTYNKSNISDEKLKALWILLDSFTCTRTGMNTNASRCGKRVTLNFSHVNHNIVLMGLHLHVFLFDKNRLFRRSDREPTYHIFYNFLSGINAKQMQLYNLKFMNEPNIFMTPLQREPEKQSAIEKWELICQAAFILGISEIEWNVICRILAAIFHLGAAKATSYHQNGQTFGTFLNRDAAKRAADTLNCSEEALHRAVFEYYKEELDSDDLNLRNDSGTLYNSQDLLNGFVGGLYFEVIEIIVYFINRCFNANYSRVINSIVIVDPPGFQVSTNINDKCTGMYEDLLYNYAYERLLNLNYTHNITKLKDTYTKENVNLEIFNDDEICNPILKLLDGDCKAEAFDTIGKKGLLNYIESEGFIGNEKSLVKKLNVLFSSHHKTVTDKKHRILKSLCTKTGDFTINHCNLSQTIKYNINDGLKYSKELPTFSSSEVLLSMCHNDTIQDLLTSLSKNQSETLNTKYSNKSTLANNKLEMNDIINCLTQTNHLSFVYCVSSIPNSGLCQLKDSIDKQFFDENITCGGLFSVPLVKIQLQSFHILHILRILKLSYPESLTYDSFSYLIKNIVPSSEFPNSKILDETTIFKLLDYLRVNRKRYKIGTSQIFFRLGTIFDLKNSKELASQNFIIQFQSLCRRYLAIKKVEKLKLQNDAIKIIQKNSLLYMKIKEWNWWKLYSRIRPLLSVLRVDEELKSVNDEVKVLKLKNQEIENEKDQLKKDKRQLENSLVDLENEQIVYRQKIQKLTNILEDKEKNEIQLNKKIEELQEEMVENDNKIGFLENELQISKSNASPTEINGNHKNETKNGSDHFKDPNVEKLLKESKTQKEELEVELVKTKKVCDNLKLELEDFKFQMENIVTSEEKERKQNQLEKEIRRLQKTIADEMANREKLQRENDIICSEKLLLEKELKEYKLENKRNSIEVPTYVNYDFSSMELDEKDYLFKKQKAEYEQRIKELEEEVDEANDNYDMAQKDKMKLNLQIEKLNQEKINELNEKDDEIEHLKMSNAKKIKNIELQLEEDHLKRQSMLKEKREADRIIAELKQKLESQKDITLEKKLRKELKSTKELLNNALDQIEELNCRREDKSELKEMRDKLDDAEHLNEKLLKQKNNIERELEEKNQEIENLTKSKIELDKKFKQMKFDFSNIQNHNEDLESQNETLEKKIKQLQTQVNTLTEFNNNFQEKIDNLEEENKKLINKTVRLEQELTNRNLDQVDKSEITRLQKKVSELEHKLQSEDSAKTRLQTQNEKLKDQLHESQLDKESMSSKEALDRERIKKLEKQLKEARETEDYQTTEITDLKNKYKALVEKVSDLEEELERKNYDLSIAKQRNQKLEEMLNNDDDDDDSDHSYSEILSKADSLIKSRKFSLDQSVINKMNDQTFRRNSIATEKLSTHFSDDNEY